MTRSQSALAALLCLVLAPGLLASGTLTPQGSRDQPVKLLDHRVEVVINNGFARTEVHQTFFNPNAHDVEAIYSFPVPVSAALSELTILTGERELGGEVVDDETARRIYGEEKDDGNDAGLAEKSEFDTFDFYVTPVVAQSEASFRFVYYQKLDIDTGVGRYLYPLESGGNDEAAQGFWTTNTAVERSFSFHVTLRSAWPVSKVRMPGYDGSAVVQQQGPGEYTARLEMPNTVLENDVVFYYRLEDELPGRVEVIPFRDDPDGPGTFMMVVTPGVDLHPITTGADYIFVLDVSGSMSGQLATMVESVGRALGELSPKDRFRIVTFSDNAYDLMPGYLNADEFSVEGVTQELRKIGTRGGTNIYAGLQSALRTLDDDRATSILLVTDGVSNQGIIEPRRFADLVSQYDVRVFGFLLGNSANWPLMRTLCDATGGFYQPVSSADDLLGQVMLAKSKITHEVMHDAQLSVKGVDTYELTSNMGTKIYRGQQLVLFGRYRHPGQATFELETRLTGLDRTYTTTFELPAFDDENPEIERLWAMSRIEQIEQLVAMGLEDGDEAEGAIAHYGVDYQLVTDETSMIVLDDSTFAKHGIERRNQARSHKERQAQANRRTQPVRNRRVDRNQPAFPGNAPSSGGGGGALDPLTVAMGLLLAAAALTARR